MPVCICTLMHCLLAVYIPKPYPQSQSPNSPDTSIEAEISVSLLLLEV